MIPLSPCYHPVLATHVARQAVWRAGQRGKTSNAASEARSGDFPPEPLRALGGGASLVDRAHPESPGESTRPFSAPARDPVLHPSARKAGSARRQKPDFLPPALPRLRLLSGFRRGSAGHPSERTPRKDPRRFRPASSAEGTGRAPAPA